MGGMTSDGKGTLAQVLSALEAEPGLRRKGPDWKSFLARVHQYVPVLEGLFASLYGSRPDWTDHLAALVVECAKSW